MKITEKIKQIISGKKMKNKILILTMSEKQSAYEAGRVLVEAKKLGVEAERVYYRELSFDLSNNSIEVLIRGEKVKADEIAGIWFRVAGTKSGKYVEARNLLIRGIGKDVFCDNATSYSNWPRMGKISQHGVFLENGIPIVPTRIFYTREQVLGWEPKKDLGWPLIAKHERGYQGRSVKKLDNQKELTGFVNRINEKNIGMFLWQKYLPTKWDIRVIVIDGKAIGAMRRSASGEEFRSNFSLGGAVEKWELSESDRLLAEKTARVCGLDYVGVDIMKDEKDQSYILEVNRQCQFKGFEQATGINVARQVVEMLTKTD